MNEIERMRRIRESPSLKHNKRNYIIILHSIHFA